MLRSTCTCKLHVAAPTPSDEIMANKPCPPDGLGHCKVSPEPTVHSVPHTGSPWACLCTLPPHLPRSQWCCNTGAQAARRSFKCFCNHSNPTWCLAKGEHRLGRRQPSRGVPSRHAGLHRHPAGTTLSARPGSLPEGSHQPHREHLPPSRHHLAVTSGTGHTLAASPVIPAHPIMLSPVETGQTSSLAWQKMSKDAET